MKKLIEDIHKNYLISEGIKTIRFNNNIEQPHEIRDYSKYKNLVDSIINYGWNGLPLILLKNGSNSFQSFNGSHRIAALRGIHSLTHDDIYIPVVEVEKYREILDFIKRNFLIKEEFLSDFILLCILRHFGLKNSIADNFLFTEMLCSNFARNVRKTCENDFVHTKRKKLDLCLFNKDVTVDIILIGLIDRFLDNMYKSGFYMRDYTSNMIYEFEQSNSYSYEIEINESIKQYQKYYYLVRDSKFDYI